MIAFARELVDVLFAGVWQGACIALTATVVLFLGGRRLNAATRYVVLQAALLAIALFPLVTTLPSVTPRASVEGGRAVVASPAARSAAVAKRSPATDPHRIDVTLSDTAVLLLAGAWAIGVGVFALRIAVGSLQLARLLRRSKRLDDWNGVRLYASADLSVPIASGFASPSIIVPTLLLAMPGDDFECVLLHELAHLRRHDAWANVGERILQACLFFNPAVLLLLRAMALEREAACDDWAIVQSRDIEGYVRSLASFAVWGAQGRARAAYGAAEFGHATITRIRRLEDERRNRTLRPSQGALGGFTIMLLGIALSLYLFAPAIAFAPAEPMTPVSQVSPNCSKWVQHRPDGVAVFHFPRGLDTKVEVVVSPARKVVSATTVKRSGNACFDQAVIDNGLLMGRRSGKMPTPGTHVYELKT